MSDLVLPSKLELRINALPNALRGHINRVRKISRELAAVHGIDVTLADLTAAAHDVARHIPPQVLLKEAELLGLPIKAIERNSPIILHGPVGACWLRDEGTLENSAALEGVYWHTVAHPDLSLLGQVVLLADKLDPSKRNKFPFQPQVRQAAFHSLSDGLLAFLDGILRQQLEQGELIHPTSSETRNRLITAASC